MTTVKNEVESNNANTVLADSLPPFSKDKEIGLFVYISVIELGFSVI